MCCLYIFYARLYCLGGVKYGVDVAGNDEETFVVLRSDVILFDGYDTILVQSRSPTRGKLCHCVKFNNSVIFRLSSALKMYHR